MGEQFLISVNVFELSGRKMLFTVPLFGIILAKNDLSKKTVAIAIVPCLLLTNAIVHALRTQG